jgi:dienelactone hydrolase
MRPLEWLLVVICVLAVVWALALGRKSPRSLRILSAVAVIVMFLQVIIEGIHWQMAPIYLAAILLAIGALGPFSNRIARAVLAGFAGLLLAGGIAICWAMPMFHLPKPTGPYAIGTRTLFLTDPDRQEIHRGAPAENRKVTIQIWYPAASSKGPRAFYRRAKETDRLSSYQTLVKTDSIQDAAFASGRYPVILFNHAYRGFRNRSTYIAQEIASQGFIVVALAHPYNSAWAELADGRVITDDGQPDLGNFYSKPHMTFEQRLAVANVELGIQVGDCKFVLNELAKLDQQPHSPFTGHLDTQQVGAYGHSFGGAVSAELAREDPQVKAVLELDGDLYGPVVTEGLAKPLMMISEAGTEPTIPHSNDPNSEVHLQFQKQYFSAVHATMQKFGGYQLLIRGAVHESFSDKGFFTPLRQLSGLGELPAKRAAKIIDPYAVAFFRQTLLNQPQPLLAGEIPPPPEATFVIWKPGSPPKTISANQSASASNH